MIQLDMFDCIKDSQLKAWNRYQAIMNLSDSGMRKEAGMYFDSFSEEDQLDIANVMISIDILGLEQFKSDLSRRLDETTDNS